jgi:D-alanyl-lipoteichoic acid acyltransferase DltB (MBOAT superfamily)
MILLSQKIGFHYNIKMIRLLLPIGLSFHTFQSLSYVIEVYRGKQKAEKHFGIYSLYVMFYPQLVTGPIERPQNLLVQLREKKTFQYANLVEGLRLILFGLFTKMVVADNLAVYVDQVYGSPATHNTVSILIGLVFYSFQIYCDFFGYSTIAVGCARAMGYNLMDNFKNPYLSKSIGEFWQRWHISLSTWFRDYVYISLGGNRVNVKRWMFNILVVFGLSGLWHGANWTFVLWGLAHGLVYILENLVTRLLKLKHPETRWMITVTDAFNVVKTFVIVSFIWILFRATDVSHVKSILVSLVNNLNVADNFSVDMKTWLFFALFIVLDVLLFKSRFDRWCNQRSTLVRWSMYAAMIFMIIVFSSVSNFPFIYFQF